MTPTLDADILCAACGYNLRGLSPEARCPECGAPVGPSLEGPAPRRGRLAAAAGLMFLAALACHVPNWQTGRLLFDLRPGEIGRVLAFAVAAYGCSWAAAWVIAGAKPWWRRRGAWTLALRTAATAALLLPATVLILAGAPDWLARTAAARWLAYAAPPASAGAIILATLLFYRALARALRPLPHRALAAQANALAWLLPAAALAEAALRGARDARFLTLWAIWETPVPGVGFVGRLYDFAERAATTLTGTGDAAGLRLDLLMALRVVNALLPLWAAALCAAAAWAFFRARGRSAP